jgi:hypothetical protein
MIPQIDLHVTYEQYLAMGYSAVPENTFTTLISRAGLYAETITLGRARWSYTPLPDQDDAPEVAALRERNMRGICELADLYHRSEAAVGENGAAIIAFTNEGYRETYESGSRGQGVVLLQYRLATIINAFFTTAQRSRRVVAC